jgi:hypothetical protein
MNKTSLHITLGFCLALLLCGTQACKQDSRDVSVGEGNIPDSLMISGRRNANEFRADLSQVEIDEGRTMFLDGEWLVETGVLTFFKTTWHKRGRRVVFHDTGFVQPTPWGSIRYNRAVECYFNDTAADVYEYFVDPAGKLNLINYEYGEDHSAKNDPLMVTKKIDMNRINRIQFELSQGEQKVLLNRKPNAPLPK